MKHCTMHSLFKFKLHQNMFFSHRKSSRCTPVVLDFANVLLSLILYYRNKPFLFAYSNFVTLTRNSIKFKLQFYQFIGSLKINIICTNICY